ncbi:golgin subfamily A member 6-like protein 22 [Cryptotermes secundus]|uniref:golgin subfamily A member 6-like protein 22 n=1 Tax=Cryptotermes secundus TaxID=105785 RepID=UPI000CD7B6EA|nr:golgin subfamily A member 6-like protein 22 [Cryptotermes secundus]
MRPIMEEGEDVEEEEEEVEDEQEDDAKLHDQLNSLRTEEDEEESPVHDDNEKYSESYFALRREQQQLRFQERGVHIMRPIMEEGEDVEEEEEEVEDEQEDDAKLHDQLNSLRTEEDEEESPVHDDNEKYSESYFALRREQQQLRFQERGVHIMRPIMEEGEDEEEEDEKEDEAKLHDQLNSLRTEEDEEESPVHDDNDKYSESYFTLRGEQQQLRSQERGVHIMRPIMEEGEDEEDEDEVKDEHEDDAKLHDQLNSVRRVEVEEEQPPHFQNEGDSSRNLKVRANDHSLTFQQTEMPIIMEDEQDAHPQDEVDPMKIKADSLPLTITKEIVGHQATMESPVEMRGRRENLIAASKPTVEKKKELPVKKTGLGLVQPPNLKARTAKAVSQSSPHNRPGRSNVKIYSKKMDYSKVKAKVDTWRK